jgi:hypothetical protein
VFELDGMAAGDIATKYPQQFPGCSYGLGMQLTARDDPRPECAASLLDFFQRAGADRLEFPCHATASRSASSAMDTPGCVWTKFMTVTKVTHD